MWSTDHTANVDWLLRALPVKGRVPPNAKVSSPASARRLIEEFQIGRRLILAGRHQVAVAADEIVVLADHHVMVALGADIFEPDRLGTEVAPVGLHHGPRSRQRVEIG